MRASFYLWVKKKLETKKFGILVFILLPLFILSFFWIKTQASLSATFPFGKTYPEVVELANQQGNFKELSDYFRNLAKAKGGAYAFEVLKRMPTVPNIDMHLLGHIVGDELYKQEKIAGIKVCTPDLRNACSHSIVIGALFEHGPSVLPEIADTCRKAPGGSGAYTMCYHGLGHGVLGYVEYEIPKAIELCKRTGTVEYRNREYVECVGGMIMEMIGGVHDPQLRIEKSKIYFKAEDPLYPCTADFMPGEAKAICYTYITPHLFHRAGGDLAALAPAVFTEAFQYCAQAPEEMNRLECYAGFGKEFVVLAAERDVRVVDELKDTELQKVFSWCALAEEPKAIQACTNSVITSLYWGGENDPAAAIRYCSLMGEDTARHLCFATLYKTVASYTTNVEQGRKFCLRIPSAEQQSCKMYFDSRP